MGGGTTRVSPFEDSELSSLWIQWGNMQTYQSVPSKLIWWPLPCIQWSQIHTYHCVTSKAMRIPRHVYLGNRKTYYRLPREPIWGLLTLNSQRPCTSLSITVYPVSSYKESLSCIQWGLVQIYRYVPSVLTMYQKRPCTNLSVYPVTTYNESSPCIQCCHLQF